MNEDDIDVRLAVALDRLSFAVLLLAGDGRRLFANTAARVLLEDHEPARTVGPVSVAARACCPTTMGLSRSAGPPPRVTVLRQGASGPYALDGWARYRRADSTPSNRILGSMAVNAVKDEDSRPRFGLTPAEWNIACRLADGLTACEVAHEAGVSLNTVRTHLKKIFQKLGVRRQAELVRHMTIASALRAR